MTGRMRRINWNKPLFGIRGQIDQIGAGVVVTNDCMMIDDGRSGGDDEDDLYMIIHPLSLQRGPLEAPTAPVACAPSPGPMAVGGMGRYGP